MSTLVYASGEDEEHVQRLARATESHGGVVHRVQLQASEEALCARLDQPSRAGTNKIRDTAQLRHFLARFDTATPMPDTVLRLRTDHLAPPEAAAAIGEHLGLTPLT